MVEDLGERIRSKLHGKMVYFLTPNTMIHPVLRALRKLYGPIRDERVMPMETFKYTDVSISPLVKTLFILKVWSFKWVRSADFLSRKEINDLVWYGIPKVFYSLESRRLLETMRTPYYFNRREGFFIAAPPNGSVAEEIQILHEIWLETSD